MCRVGLQSDKFPETQLQNPGLILGLGVANFFFPPLIKEISTEQD